MRISIPIPSHAQLHGGGFEAGFFHPVLGLDHLLAMVAVGILATQMGGKNTWRIPLAFVLMMIVGAVLGMKGISLFKVEYAIALSVMILGFAIARDKTLPLFVAFLFVSFFAIFHGHAHGAEMPRMGSACFYAGGFVLATVLLHLAGVVFVYIVKKFVKGRVFLSHVGSGLVGIGLYMLFLRVF